jgi:uncharacterized membrane protein (DUF373 family)
MHQEPVKSDGNKFLDNKLVSAAILWFERILITVLVIMMGIVVVSSIAELGLILVQDMITPPILILDVNELLEIFSIFLLILIGIELVETIKVFFTEQIIRVEVVLLVGIIAITRKVIVLDIKTVPSLSLIGIGVIVVALTCGYYLIKKSRKVHGI